MLAVRVRVALRGDTFFRRSLFTAPPLRMPIKVGESIPSVEVDEGAPGTKVNMRDLFAGKRGVLIAVPGAFTPNCSNAHVPGYVRNYERLKSHGVEVVACVSVNDAYVMAAWEKEKGATGKMHMLADTNGEFTKAVDLGLDAKVLGGYRSKRYSMLIEDGVVKVLNIEPDGIGLTCSLAENLKFN